MDPYHLGTSLDNGVAGHNQRTDQVLCHLLPEDLTDKSLPRNSQAHRPTQGLKLVQPGDQFQVMPAGLAEADAGIDDDMVAAYTHGFSRVQPFFEIPADVVHDVLVMRGLLHGRRRSLHVHQHHAGPVVARPRRPCPCHPEERLCR